ncbi:MAG: potassium-transporting ATPase subunit KdpC [Thermoleophilia bacterium]
MKIKEIKRALLLLVIFLVLLTVIYPAVVTLVAKVAFPYQAGGSLISENGKTMGSSLIGQPFSHNKYFWSRPSATGSTPYDASASGGSNLGPTNPALLDEVGAAAQSLRDSGVQGDLPMDLVTSSGSGLDPDISIEAALVQVARVASARNMTVSSVKKLVNDHKQSRTLGFLGTERVNVLELNMALDQAG